MKKMKKIILVTILIFSIFITISCKKDNSKISDYEWIAKSFKSNPTGVIDTTNKTYILDFDDNSFHFKLDVNACSGKVNFKKNNQVSFSLPGCTEACCDEKLPTNIAENLPLITNYELNGDKLILMNSQPFLEITFVKK